MTLTPEIAAVLRFFARAKSGHSDYDRGIRDNVYDALRGSQLDPYGFAYWGHRALTLHELSEAGCRYTREASEYDAAVDRALELVLAFRPWGDTLAQLAHCELQLRRAAADIQVNEKRRRNYAAATAY